MGRGRKLNEQLQQGGITTVRQLRDFDVSRIRNRFGVVMERTVRELRRGICLDMVDIAPPRQQIIILEASGKAHQLERTAGGSQCLYVHSSGKAARAGLCCRSAHVYIITNVHRQNISIQPGHHHRTRAAHKRHHGTGCGRQSRSEQNLQAWISLQKSGGDASEITSAGVTNHNCLQTHLLQKNQ